MKRDSEFEKSLSELMVALWPIQRRLIAKYGKSRWNAWIEERQLRSPEYL